MTWNILTGEYPPQRGGVSTYTQQVARGLADAGDRVIVWAPQVDGAGSNDRDVTVRRLPDTFGRRSLKILTSEFDRKPSRILVQYVPHAFGWKGANLPFCHWLASRSRDRIWIMFHEVGVSFDAAQSPLLNALAVANRIMARLAVRSAERAFISIPGWRPMLQPFATGKHAMTFEWLPVPSGMAVVGDTARVDAVRAQVGSGHPIVGHFGTHPASIRMRLAEVIVRLAATTDCRVLLIGPRGTQLRDELIAGAPALRARLFATGPLSAADVSAHITACDVMLQPYPDGISTRRTSAMAALAHGVAVVTTLGWLTEPMWRAADAVMLAPAEDGAALADGVRTLLMSETRRAQLAEAGRRLYDTSFDVRHTIAVLRGAAQSTVVRIPA
jgi:glycosyltransferase involved in cell wall biosynthesis